MSERSIKIALNGFGRIGRTILRILARDAGAFDLVAINDIASLDACAYLFEYDSVFGVFPGSVDTRPGTLIVDGRAIPFHREEDISRLDLAGADLVLDCTGHADDGDNASRGLRAGVGAVLISGPSKAAEITLVMGANEGLLAGQRIVSNASCTTNALAPLLKVLDAAYGIESGQMTTIHCYTGSQPTVDLPRGDPARSRAAALSMVPTTTSAARLMDVVLPELAGRIEGRAIRVPTASVSAIDLTVKTRKEVGVETVNAMLKAQAERSALFGWIEKPLVSSDLRGRPESIVLSGLETSVARGGLLRVFGWYDNEWGFSSRMLDMAALMTRR